MNAIEVRNVHKSFKIYYDKGATFKEKILFRNRKRHEVHKVLKGIDITIKKGEVVGFIGENGCGKSTLLKLMTRIIYPDQGSIEVNGKVSSLLELGAGFHPDMSGRENIYTNASIFGLTKKQIDQRIEKIIDFSELGEFIDNPVRTYSSGMYMRLAFSVAINVDAEILLIDEILAVGDAAFQAKCFNKMQEIKNSGATIVIVSHDLGSIERLCDRAVWVNKGQIVTQEKTHNVVCQYLDWVMNKQYSKEIEQEEYSVSQNNEVSSDSINQKPHELDLEKEIKRWGNKDIEITKISLLDYQGKKINNIRTGREATICISFKNKTAISEVIVGVGITRTDKIMAYGTNTRIDGVRINNVLEQGTIKLYFETLNLLPGEYYLDIAFEHIDTTPLDYYCEAMFFTVYSDINDVGMIRIGHKWLVDDKEV